MYYIGLDVHKKTISYCVKDASGQVQQEGKIGSTRRELDEGATPAMDRKTERPRPGALPPHCPGPDRGPPRQPHRRTLALESRRPS
jgi:hypothetical protein